MDPLLVIGLVPPTQSSSFTTLASNMLKITYDNWRPANVNQYLVLLWVETLMGTRVASDRLCATAQHPGQPLHEYEARQGMALLERGNRKLTSDSRHACGRRHGLLNVCIFRPRAMGASLSTSELAAKYMNYDIRLTGIFSWSRPS